MKSKNILKKIICFIAALTLIMPCLMPQIEVSAASSKKAPRETLKTFIEWKRVRYYKDLPRDNNLTRYIFIVWSSENDNPNSYDPSAYALCCCTYTTEHYEDGQDTIRGVRYASSNYSKVFFVDKDEFITSSPYGMPKIWYEGDDGSNYNNPTYKIKLDAGRGKYVMSDGSDHFKFRDNESHKWGIAVHEPGAKNLRGYEQSADWDATVCLFYNKSGGYDNGFVFHGTKLTSEKDKDYDDFDSFMIWIGTEKQYTVITEDFTVTPGNVFNTKDGLVIDNNVTVTVQPGAVFSVEGACINSGIIKNYGTVVIEKDSAMFPMMMGKEHVDEAGAINAGANKIECHGGSESLSVPGYKKEIQAEGTIINFGSLGFMKGMGSLSLLNGSTFDNRGFLVTAGDFYVKGSQVLNHGVMAIGYDLRNPAEIYRYDIGSYPTFQELNVVGIKMRYVNWHLSMTKMPDGKFTTESYVAKNYPGGIVYINDADAVSKGYFTE